MMVFFDMTANDVLHAIYFWLGLCYFFLCVCVCILLVCFLFFCNCGSSSFLLVYTHVCVCGEKNTEVISKKITWLNVLLILPSFWWGEEAVERLIWYNKQNKI